MRPVAALGSLGEKAFPSGRGASIPTPLPHSPHSAHATPALFIRKIFTNYFFIFFNILYKNLLPPTA